MADYWVSTKRWTCKYCDITINDDAPSRRQHEEGLRHKNNVQRALRDVYKRQEKEAREKEEAKREMSRIERLAAEAHRSDIASGASPPGPSTSTTASTSTSRSPPAPTSTSQRWAPSNKLSAYGSLAADEEALRWQREAEAAEQARVQQEEERRERAAIPGDWEEVTHAPVASSSTPANINVAPHAGLGERSEARAFRFKERKAASDDEEEDGQAAVIKVKKRERAPDTDAGRLERERLEERARLRPEDWSGGLRLAAPGASGTRSSAEDGEAQEEVAAPVKKEEDADEEDSKVASTAAPSVETSEPGGEASTAPPPLASPPPPPAAPTSNPFRKRKAGSGAGSKKVRLA